VGELEVVSAGEPHRTGHPPATLATTGNFLSRQPSIPPASGRTLLIPNLFILSATRALESSLGQEQ